MAMVRSSSAAASQLTRKPIAATDATPRIEPMASASCSGTTPRGIGRIAVRDMTASMSASHHMLSAPQAPAPAAIADRVVTRRSQSMCPGATT